MQIVHKDFDIDQSKPSLIKAQVYINASASYTVIGSDHLLLSGTLGRNFSEICIKIQQFSYNNIELKMLSVKLISSRP